MIVQWRDARVKYIKAKNLLAKAIAEERLRELSLRTYPSDRLDRRDGVRKREQSLERDQVVLQR